MRLHHTGLHVQDLERSIAFYTRHFGFRLRGRGSFGETPLAFLELAGGLLELVQEPPSPAETPCGHIALAVESLSESLDRLRGSGVVLLDPEPLLLPGGGATAFCAGPDGEWIELMELPDAIRGAAPL